MPVHGVPPVLLDFTPGPYLQIPAQLCASEIMHWPCSSPSNFIPALSQGFLCSFLFDPVSILIFILEFSWFLLLPDQGQTLATSHAFCQTWWFAMAFSFSMFLACTWFKSNAWVCSVFALSSPDWSLQFSTSLWRKKIYCTKVKVSTSTTLDQKRI